MQDFLPNTPWSPAIYLACFLGSSLFMIWTLSRLEKRGLEGTAIGTLVMPYCSGLSNLIFAFQMGERGPRGASLVMENCLVNNATNLTLLIGLPTLIWGMDLLPPSKKSKGKAAKVAADNERLNRLSLLLTLCAGLFFTGALWTLAGDGRLSQRDGWILVGLFLFWQFFQVFDVLKYNIHQKRKLSSWMALEFLCIVGAGYVMFDSIDWLVDWFSHLGNGFVGTGGLGWVSGWMMVLPNAFLAFYYAYKKRADIAYSSQVGDGHICIPLCIGLYALFVEEAKIPMKHFDLSIAIIAGAIAVQMLFVVLAGRLPKWLGAIFIGVYVWFCASGLST
jgi:cation:H+ antiporter